MIKAFKRILGCFTLFVFVFSCYLSVYAAGQIYDNVKITELVKVPTKTVEDEKCSNLGCIGINEANGKNCMFAVKAGQNDGVAVLYYYPDMSDLTTRKHFIIYGAGHANGMTIDSNYIYITTWSNKNIDENEGISNEIMQIPKNLFNTLSSGSVVPEKSNSTGGIELLQPMKINTDPQTKEDNPYVKYTESFSSITKHKKDNTFIIKKI